MESLLVTHSVNDGGMSERATLPLHFGRSFRPWRYGVSHSELVLRTVDNQSRTEIMKVTFFGVLGVKLKSRYRSLDISVADAAEAAEILSFVGLSESHAPKVQCLLLNAETDGGFVACGNFSVWAYPRDAQYDPSGIAHREPRLIFRS